MATENFKKAGEIFQNAIEIEDPTKRERYLENACEKDPKLRVEVEALLKSHEEAGDFLEIPPIDLDVTLDESPLTEGPETVIGRYKLLEKIGEGGMATVYMAEQKHPIRRRVALKIIKLGMDTKQVIARFEAERQALAMMDHPNIAKVLDAGTTDTGRPYFVMELVRGVSITEFCDKNNLNTRERLGLFVSVCQAVQHAHQKGIIHRDIKPSNVMVTLHDGEPVPKVIDFGIAKAVNQQLTEKTVFTRYAQMIGTPEYMSPEQAEMSGLDVDIRTDVFSLGVLLYELLTGTTPFDQKYLLSKGYAEMQRIIREEEPTRPSTKISTLGEALIEIAKHRRTSPDLLQKLIRTDLDWIVMKTLEKDRSRRYDSVSEFVADIKRHLNNELVLAGRPSTLYRIRKFVRRRRALVASVAAVAAVVVVGFIVSTVMYLQAEQARKKEALAREKEEKARSEAQNVADFLTEDLLASVYPEKAKSPEVTVRYILKAAEENLKSKFADNPLAEAKIRETLGRTYNKLGDYKAAEPHVRRALEIHRQQLGDDNPSTLTSLSHLGELYGFQGRFAEAKPLLVMTLEARSRVLGEEHPDTVASMSALGWLYMYLLRSDDAEALFVKAIEIGNRVLGEEHPIVLDAICGLAFRHIRGGNSEEALLLSTKGFEISRRILGDEHELTLDFMNQLAWEYERLERYDVGMKLAIKALEISQRAMGEEHRITVQAMNQLGWLYTKQSRYKEAAPLLLKSVELSRQVLGESHIFTLYFAGKLNKLRDELDSLGSKHYYAGEYEAALVTFANIQDISQVLSGQSRVSDITFVAMSLHHLGRHQEAKITLDRLRGIFKNGKHVDEEKYLYEAEKLFVDENSGIYQVWELIEVGKLDEALKNLETLQESQHTADVVTSDSMQNAMKALARAYCTRGTNSETRGDYTQAISDYESAIRVNPRYAPPLRELAWLRATCPADEIRDGAKAIELATEACELTNWEKAEYVDALAAAHAEKGSFTTAVKRQKTAIALLPHEEHTRWLTDYRSRLRLYESGKPYHRQKELPMVAWWKFDQAIGGNMIDSSGNGLNGKLVGDAKIIADAERGSVLSLEGSGYVDCGTGKAFDITGPITVAAWIKINTLDQYFGSIVAKGDFAWRLQSKRGVIQFGCSGLVVPGVSYGYVDGDTDVMDGKWHHVAGTYDGMRICVYFDGALDASEQASGQIATNGFNVNIGENAQTQGRGWNGLIDDVRIYAEALTEAEINALYDDKEEGTTDQ